MTATFHRRVGFFLSVANKHFMVDLPGKSWADLYREALLEVNPNRLPHLVEVAMDAVQSKLRAFPDGKISSTERQLLEDALKNLRVLQREYS